MVFDNIDFNSTAVDFGDAHISIYHAKKCDKSHEKRDVYKVIYHSHFYFELHLLLGGSRRFFINDKCVPFSEKQVLIIPPFVDHSPFNEYGEADEIVFALSFEKTLGDLVGVALRRGAVCRDRGVRRLVSRLLRRRCSLEL